MSDVSASPLDGASKATNVTDPRFIIAPSDNSNTVFVSDLLTVDNYADWKRDLRLALITRNKLGFIDDTIPEPPPESTEYVEWFRVDALVRSGILKSISKTLVNNFKNLETARLLCQSLEQLYGQLNAFQIYEVNYELLTLNQAAMNVSEFYTKLHTLWLSLDVMLPELSDLTARRILRLAQFLHGLNDCFESVRQQALSMDPLPTPEKAYSMALQAERRLKFVKLPDANQESALVVKGVADTSTAVSTNAIVSRDPKGRYCHKCKKEGHITEECFGGSKKRPLWWFRYMKRLGNTIPLHIELINVAVVPDAAQTTVVPCSSALFLSPTVDVKLQGIPGVDTKTLKQIIKDEIQRMFRTPNEQANALTHIEFTGPGF